MSADNMQTLEGLFNSFDSDKTGYIDKSQLRNLCKGISLTNDEFETIFLELDADGDDKISKDDFIRGFCSDSNELLNTVDTHKASGSNKLNVSLPEKNLGDIKRNSSRNRLWNEAKDNGRHASVSWPDFIEEIGKDFALLPEDSQEQVRELYDRLTDKESPEALTQFEDIVHTMISQAVLQNAENERLEQSYHREKEKHAKHLQQLEEEMEGQVQRIEQRIAEQKRQQFELEKSELTEKLTKEIADLQESLSHLQNDEDTAQSKSETESMKTKLDELFHSNRSLQSTLTDAQTNLAVTRTELAQLKQSYAEKCRDLELERETLKEYMQEQENLTQQLHLLHDANKKLHDTNDDLRETTEYTKKTLRQSSREPPLSLTLDQITNRSQYVADYVKSSSMHNIHNMSARGSSSSLAEELRDHSFSLADELSQSERRPRLSPTPVQHSVEDDNDVPEDVDSGHSTLQGIHETSREESKEHILPRHDLSPKGGRSPVRCSTPNSSPYLGGRHSLYHNSVDRDYSFDDISEITELTHDATLQDELAELTDNVTEEDLDRIRPNLSRPGSACSFSSRASGQSRASSRASKQSFRRHLNRLPRGMPSAPERMYKVVLCGDAAVGKSSFILRLCKNMFVRNLHSTLGVDFQTKTVEVDGRQIALQLWDTAGQERFRSIAKSYFRRADGVFLLYDCSYERSFTNVREWMNTIEDGAQRSIPIMLIGNKTDLRDTKQNSKIRFVTYEEGQHLARAYDALFIETSAKDGSNIQESATEFARLLKSNEDLEVRTVGMKLHEMKSSKHRFLPDKCCSN